MHADFVSRPAHQWRGKGLAACFRELDSQLRADTSRLHWFVLDGGAFVILSLLECGRRRLQIARTEKPKDPVAGPKKFARECDTFAEYFNITHWPRQVDTEGTGISCIFTEPEPLPPHCGNCGGTKDANASWAGSLVCTECATVAKLRGMEPCDRCGKLVRTEPAFDVQHCQACAVACGRETSAILARRRAEAST